MLKLLSYNREQLHLNFVYCHNFLNNMHVLKKVTMCFLPFSNAFKKLPNSQGFFLVRRPSYFQPTRKMGDFQNGPPKKNPCYHYMRKYFFLLLESEDSFFFFYVDHNLFGHFMGFAQSFFRSFARGVASKNPLTLDLM